MKNQQIGNNDDKISRNVTEILYKLISDVVLTSQKHTAWVCVRASLPKDKFDMPRWHTDGTYYSPRDSLQYKFAAALKGSQTLFLPMNDEMRNLYEENYTNREFLSRLFDSKKAECAQRGQGAFFLVGNPKIAALHSEPCIHAPRLFISVLPGNQSEIEELDHRWNFPSN